MHIVLINQFYPPASAPTGKLMSDVARALVRRGHQITVVTSASGYGATGVAEKGSSDDDAIRVIRLGNPNRHGTGLFSKLGDYFDYFRLAAQALDRLAPVPDLVVCLTTPPFCGRIGYRFLKKQGVPFAVWCMDLYPEALAAHGIVASWNPIYWILRIVARTERRCAGAVITLGPDMTELVRRDDPVHVVEVPVWSNLSATEAIVAEAKILREQRGWGDDELILLYSGNMGRAHRAEEFAALANQLCGMNKRSRMVMSGAGPKRDEWRRKFGDVFEFIPPVSGNAVASHLLAADIHLVSQEPAWNGIVVPSKFQAACALGRPVIFAGAPDSSVGQWVREADCGWVIPPDDHEACRKTAQEIVNPARVLEKGRRASHLFAKRFEPEINQDQICAVLESLYDSRV